MDTYVERIQELKKQKDAIILAHYYVSKEIQEIADYVGDSFYLSRIAKNTDAKYVVFAGVRFMGESAKLLNPSKTVILPDMNADCPMAHMASEAKIKEMRERYDDLAVVCYINSSLRLKALSDVCITSSNAIKVVQSLPHKNIFVIPDRHLGRYIQSYVKDKNIILNDGCCPIHDEIKKEDVLKVKDEHPFAKICVHPECRHDVIELADYVGSTSQIIDYVSQHHFDEVIVVTEEGILYELQQQNPHTRFYLVSHHQYCPDMKKITLEKIYQCLKDDLNCVEVDERDFVAIKPLDKMLELG